MPRKLGTVQRKLSELESELSSVFRLPPHPDSYRKIFRYLNKRFNYVSNLLAAEVAASTPEKTHQLKEMGSKLATLDAAFCLWNKYHTYALHQHIEDSDDDADGPDPPQSAVEKFAGGGGEEDRGRIWGGFRKLCGAFGGGIIAGAVCCMCIVNFPSFYISELYDDIYIIHPT